MKILPQNNNVLISYCTFIYIVFIFFFVSHALFAYPLISSINKNDIVYQQFILRKKDSSSFKGNNDIVFFEYNNSLSQTTANIANTIQISLSTLITVNRYSTRYLSPKESQYVIIPNISGVFISLSPKSDVEFLINERLSSSLKKQRPITIRSNYSNLQTTFYFIPNVKLSKHEIALWKSKKLRSPVLKGYVSSGFGYRISPISGKRIFHKGVDIAYKSGSEIFTAQNGTIEKEGYDSVFGYYIIIRHDKTLTTLYGHMIDIVVKVGSFVYAGAMIGRMGSTGASTGAHVHFEIHENNKPVNPMKTIDFNQLTH